MKLNLVSNFGDPTWIQWDPVSGVVSGPAAEQVRRLVKQSLADGDVCTDPIPTCYDITDPLHSRRDMALVLSLVWKIPTELQPDFPEPPPEPELTGDPSIPELKVTILN